MSVDISKLFDGNEIVSQFVRDFELTLLDATTEIGTMILRMRNGGYTEYEMYTDPMDHEAVVEFRHTSGESVSGKDGDVIKAFKKALDAGITQARARIARERALHTPTG